MMQATKKLVDCFHSVYDGYVVFTDEALELLPEDVKYTMRGPLVLVPLEELDELPDSGEIKQKVEEYRQRVREYYKRTTASSTENPRDHIGAPSGSSTLVLVSQNTSNSNSIVTGSSRFSTSSSRFSTRIEFRITDSKLQEILRKVRARPERFSTSIYIDRRIWQLFKEALAKIGLHKKQSEVMEELILTFLDSLEKQLEGG